MEYAFVIASYRKNKAGVEKLHSVDIEGCGPMFNTIKLDKAPVTAGELAKASFGEPDFI